MPLDFPADRTELTPPGVGPLQTGDTFTSGGRTWVYDSSIPAWEQKPNTVSSADITDIATANLPTINSPLGTALSAKMAHTGGTMTNGWLAGTFNVGTITMTETSAYYFMSAMGAQSFSMEATAKTNIRTALGVGTSDNVTFGSIQNTAIGSTTASTGAFTTVTVNDVVKAANGTVSAPAYSFSSHANSGFYDDTLGNIAVSILGTRHFQFNATIFSLVRNDGYIKFGSSSDVGIYRNAAGVVEINNGTAGTFRDLKLRNLISAPVTVANLAGAAQGARSFVTDATQTLTAGIGTVVAGGGSNAVPVYYDGTNWRIG